MNNLNKPFMVRLLLLLFVFVTALSYGQNHSDCNSAIVLDDSTYTYIGSPEGYGSIMEVKGGRNNPLFFEKEHHTVWYKIEIPWSGTFTMEIQPHQLKDDYDFIVFRDTIQFCELIRQQLVKPIRSNIARNDLSLNSSTGLSQESSLLFQQEGIGKAFSSAIEVDSGEVLYLLLDNVYENGSGHDLFWRVIPNENIKERKLEQSSIQIMVFDKDSLIPLLSNIEIRLRGVSKYRPPLDSAQHISNAYFFIEPFLKYQIHITAENYFSFQTEVKAESTNDTLLVEAFLERIAVGNKVKIENIYFRGGTAQFMPDSYSSLRALRNILKKNEKLKIEIQGHVNRPYNSSRVSSKKDLMNLSIDRSKAVYDYLVRRGIEKERLSFKGFSNSKMLFPYAKSADEQQQNRRVEFEILSVD